jgi:hypothetical protein
MRIPLNRLPYGAFVAENYSTLFDRCYRPLVRLEGQWPKCDSATAVECDPAERVFHLRTFYFCTGADCPRRDSGTRRRLAELVSSIPALDAEIERRASVNADAS